MASRPKKYKTFTRALAATTTRGCNKVIASGTSFSNRGRLGGTAARCNNALAAISYNII